ncbi:MAG: DUF5695 domain-containing protein [bacterium]|nr:DUF5695 domain-containing protein [bacterium]
MEGKRVKKVISHTIAGVMAAAMVITSMPAPALVFAEEGSKTAEVKSSEVKTEELSEGFRLSNDYFVVETGKYGNIKTLKLKDDLYDTNYVMNAENASAQASAAGHQWMGELMFKVKSEGAKDWSEENTGRSDSGRNISLEGNKVVVTYENATEEKGIKSFKLVETYSLTEDGKLRWEITVTNTKQENLVIGDFGVPLAFNEYWPGNEEIYETRTVDHSFVGKDSSYIYITRPSGLGKFLVMTPDTSTGAGFEYQDHWRTQERAADEASWCQDQSGWANGLNVFYIHSDVIKSTNRGYLDNTSLTLKAGETKTYAFSFSAADSEEEMKSILYEEGLIDAVAVPGMTYSINMPGKLYLHTKSKKEDISFDVQCPHETKLYEGHDNTVSNALTCKKTDENTYVKYTTTKQIDGEQYHIYDIGFGDLGQNNVVITYDQGKKQTVLQFYMMDDVASALQTHAEFMVDHTQINTPGKTGDKVFDDWMMDSKTVRANLESDYWQKSYWGWGDDWGLTHGEFLAEKNVYQPVAKEIEAVDQYLDVAIWNGLMREHQTDYKIHDFLMEPANTSPTYRGYAYPHIYNTYFSMYKIAKKYPDTVSYMEKADTYLMRAYHIMKALYGEGVSYNWETGLMGELTTPAIIKALNEEGYYTEAEEITKIMSTKYDKFKNTKYPYGSEYSYDNTGEEAVYTLAKVNLASDTKNALTMMQKINAKTRACRGVQPVWYHYADPTTICGENWWNFQYTASLAGYCMDDYLRLQQNGMTTTELAEAARVNYAAKLANLTAINSGQMDADEANIGAVSWTYQSEMGNLGGQGTGGGNLHNGWRQMSGESDLGLFGALQILSSDVTEDPVFGLFGYGCKVEETDGKYSVIPLDGLYTRLNLINTKFYIELERDQYTKAIIAKDNTSVLLEMKNIEGTAHDTNITFTGLKAGSYQIVVDGKTTGSFQAVDGQAKVVTMALPKSEQCEVKILATDMLENKKPVVDAGEDATVLLNEETRLVGTASDDGNVNSELTYKWELIKAEEGTTATIVNPDKKNTEVSFSGKGSYTFMFTADDGQYAVSDMVTYQVEEGKLPETLVEYTFDDITEDGLFVKTKNGKEYYASLAYAPKFGEGKENNGLLMTGKISGGYAELPKCLTKELSNATISMDVKLTGTQVNHTALISLGDEFKIELINGNELVLNVNGKTASSGIILAPDYWKNIEVTATGEDYKLFVDGNCKASLKDTGFVLKDEKEISRYLIGRSNAETEPFLNGTIDNVVVKSVAMTDQEMETVYGSLDVHIAKEAKQITVITGAGKKPTLPEEVMVLYSDGIYEKTSVVWEEVTEEQYQKAGKFEVKGKVKGTEVVVVAKVMVVSGTLQNVAADAVPSAIINTPNDLGGVAGLNDGFDPESSSDTSHGVWHNWQGNQGGAAWIQYDWEEQQILSEVELYFFKDGSGNFAPANYQVEYMGEDGSWYGVTNATGLGVELNQYNKTTYDPVMTKGLRVTINPATLGSGVIEWKVYGYKDGTSVDKKSLKAAITMAESLDATLFKDGTESLKQVIASAKAVEENAEAVQEEVDQMAVQIYTALAQLKPLVDRNMAYIATVSTSFVSGWEKLQAVNDGQVSEVSNSSSVPHYGTWGNTSAYETVTYTFGIPMKLNSSDVYFWTDGGGIGVPKSYFYEYLDEQGTWKKVSNPDNYDVLRLRTGKEGEEANLDGFNATNFDEVTTTAIRITINKQEEGADGIGLVEWRVFGEAAAEETVDPKKEQAIKDLQKTIATKPQKSESSYTKESYKAYKEALQKANSILSNDQATTEELNRANEELKKAFNALKVEVPKVIKLQLKQTNLTMYTGFKAQLQVKSAPAGKIVWSTSNAKVAKMNNGLIQAVGKGTAVIKASVAGQTAQCSVKVNQVSVPSGVKAETKSSTELKVSWKAVKGASGYEVYRLSGKTWKKIATTNKTYIKDSKKKANTTYKYRIRAFVKQSKNVSYSAYCKTVSGKTAPAAVKSLTVKKVKNTIRLSWKKVSGADGYVLYEKIGNGKYVKVKSLNSKTLSVTRKGLKKGKKYNYYICPYRKAGSKRYYASKTYSKTVKI